MARKKCPILTWSIYSIPRGIGVEAFAGRDPVGFSVGNFKKKDGQKVLEMGSIIVADKVQHCGIGTAIYQQMANAAAKRDAVLVSDTNRSWYSDKFWQKQIKKRTARCAKKVKEEKTADKTEYSLGRSGCAYYILKNNKVA